VIVGGGFAGLEAAKALRRSAVQVTLLDAQNHHCFQPLLYQVATAALSPADVAWPIRSILRRQRNARVLMARVTGVDRDLKVVRTDSFQLRYDFLILATGATHSYFGHDDWAAFAPGLKRIEDATAIRRRVLVSFERAEISPDVTQQRRLLTFVIIGGGATGVEMAGAIAEVARHTLRSDFRRIDPARARILLMEAGARVLPALSDHLSDYARSTLEGMGVEVLTRTRVTGVDEHGVSTETGRIEAGTIIWAAGVKASPAAQWIGATHDRAGRICVSSDLSVPGCDRVYAVGDTAAARDDSGKPVPGVAPAAKQMGRHVGRLIAATVRGRPGHPAFRYRHQGDLATIGRRAAVVKLGRLHLTGFIGWLFWSVVHIYFLIGVRNRLTVALSWLWNYATAERGARLITVDPDGDGRARPVRSATGSAAAVPHARDAGGEA
jgi:NADH dehydrogenase